jgi:hypothetical protein
VLHYPTDIMANQGKFLLNRQVGSCPEDQEVVLARVCGFWMVSGPVDSQVADSMKAVLRREQVIAFSCCEEEYREKGLPRSWASDEYFPHWKPDWLVAEQQADCALTGGRAA